MSAPVFYLGTHQPYWLWSGEADYPLCVSYGTLRERKSYRAATVPGWMLDSRGFSELRIHGEWTITPREYVEAVALYDREIGSLEWAAPQDWMCEDAIIHGGTFGGLKFAGTHLSVAEHQKRTVVNFRELAELWPQASDSECPFMPVLQGEPGNVASYLRCAALYEAEGIRLGDYPVVGIGSVCRIQDSPAVGRLARGLAHLDLPLHWFGLKLTGLPEVWPHITSHDSMAWSYAARREPPLPGCTGHKNCANCAPYARSWRERVVALGASLERGHYQDELFSAAEWGAA